MPPKVQQVTRLSRHKRHVGSLGSLKACGVMKLSCMAQGWYTIKDV